MLLIKFFSQLPEIFILFMHEFSKAEQGNDGVMVKSVGNN